MQIVCISIYLFICFCGINGFWILLKWFGRLRIWAGTKTALASTQTLTLLFYDAKPNQPKPISQVKSGCESVEQDLIQIRFENISIISKGFRHIIQQKNRLNLQETKTIWIRITKAKEAIANKPANISKTVKHCF